MSTSHWTCHGEEPGLNCGSQRSQAVLTWRFRLKAHILRTAQRVAESFIGAQLMAVVFVVSEVFLGCSGFKVLVDGCHVQHHILPIWSFSSHHFINVQCGFDADTLSCLEGQGKVPSLILTV